MEYRDFLDTKSDKIDFIELMYEERENKANVISNEFRKTIKDTLNERGQKYNEFVTAMKKYPEESEDSIMEKLEGYLEVINSENGQYCGQYYKEGVKDGVRLIIQCLE